jgi:geranylgeranyl diphosphate synthase type I
MIRYKSAKYTIEEPMQIGGTLAGADPALLATYSAYGLPLGEAFQLRDDVLGVFGDPWQTGKPAGDDLREGKRTVLMAQTLVAADPAQTARVHALFGSPDLDEAGVNVLREIIRDTGALAAIERLIGELVGQARATLHAGHVEQPALDVLDALIDAATDRRT